MLSVFNHGYVRLVDYMGDDESIVRAARVSYDGDGRTGADKTADAKLIHYLYANKHSTPFESVVFTFEVKAPVFVIRQWHRHRTWTYNEISARYKELSGEFYLPTVDVIGQQSKNNKQVRELIESITDQETKEREEEIQWVQEHCQQSFKLYHKLLARGWARELARIVLPFATYTHMYATVDLHNLFHFLRLRLHPHAQYEIRKYAEAILNIVTELVPIAVDAFNNKVLDCHHENQTGRKSTSITHY